MFECVHCRLWWWRTLESSSARVILALGYTWLFCPWPSLSPNPGEGGGRSCPRATEPQLLRVLRPLDPPLPVTVLLLCFFSKGPGTGLRRGRHPWRSRPEPYAGSPETLCCPSGKPWPVLPCEPAAVAGVVRAPVVGGVGHVWGPGQPSALLVKWSPSLPPTSTP